MRYVGGEKSGIICKLVPFKIDLAANFIYLFFLDH